MSNLKPILFSTPMVQAILEGRKTMTRRIVKPQPKPNHKYPLGWVTGLTDSKRIGNYGWGLNEYGGVIDLARPLYTVDDILWVRETCWKSYDGKYHFKADYVYGTGQLCKGIKIIPSIHMPREAARIFLRVTNVRVERLQDITNEQAFREGIYIGKADPNNYSRSYLLLANNLARARFADLWDSLNAKRGYSWESNPWVWVYEFKRTDKPV